MASLRHINLRIAMAVAAVTVATCIASAQTRQHMPARKAQSVVVEDMMIVKGDSVEISPIDTVAVKKPSKYDVWEEREVVFSPDPTRAVWNENKKQITIPPIIRVKKTVV
ncbi:MAG: hypothetical protein K2J10_00005, partial [Muribaculaceae bacterium]|nr:hypothetical protein [Muribaculaceae bacterium]